MMMTGMGRCAMRIFRNVSPSMRGISMSRVMDIGVEFQDLVASDIRICRCANDFYFRVGGQTFTHHFTDRLPSHPQSIGVCVRWT